MLTAPEQGRFEVKAGLKPLHEGKVMDKTRVSAEAARFDSPLSAQTQTTTKTQPPAQSLPDDPPVREVVLSDASTQTDPETSLGEVAGKVRQQKQATSNSGVSNPHLGFPIRNRFVALSGIGPGPSAFLHRGG